MATPPFCMSYLSYLNKPKSPVKALKVSAEFSDLEDPVKPPDKEERSTLFARFKSPPIIADELL